MPKRALISVSDKTGVEEFAKRLMAAGYEIISTGGTLKVISDAGLDVIAVDDVTGFPECFSGRVKTMHPKIMGGVLYRRGDAEHEAQAKDLEITSIDMVVVNLYPFEETVAKGITGDDLIEQIDIGGPTLLRSAAKNNNHVTVVCDIADYERVISEIESNGDTSQELRSELATKVFLRTAAYDTAITTALSEGKNRGLILTNGTALRYGENPHQTGTYCDLYGTDRAWKVIQEEKQMSYLNILDADGAWNLVCEYSEPTAACIKHANPSGVASHSDISEAFQRCYDADRLSAFGVIVALNTPCPAEVIQKIIDQKIFAEVIIAPGYEPEALELLKKRPKLRAIEMSCPEGKDRMTARSMLGGILIQEQDTKVITKDDLTVVTDAKPTENQIEDLLFTWLVVKHAKSNAIVFAKDKITTGIGCGQTSRVDSTIIAARRAGDRAKGSVMASDAFFPFADSIETAAKNGIVAIIQPGGSIRDEEVIAKANELGIVMVTTGVRAFKH
ncbi:MAG: bifunctional phosphoribosylaminoimidazolecarboxamide formyltransferase/IMP cyclohydrolase [Candidatus Peribacter sp.]|nr:bifunctional phosphoribosylaminoimidazolecarboxamide formyltransferase/IMP cyclohydrolase [Candidatus Peribacter sp.]MBT4393069.1 bifunctional phosphoribosylaminoimidazolecarboxamide formyltransferase/IMP cyclohydrolase [Candidatus Peribacter sp.]MBT4600867.1 bifunctional phosphoribosylaminoimidazolecarboxamide formyltransferase/IMP cyclohydrolase [Candidatus Peribacter sp.]MBT5149002.1 bifunctional phosphoribosylaminoimidazolecarboxamide formyltransferase/IMP cyclohydrolase [Candidatus Perib